MTPTWCVVSLVSPVLTWPLSRWHTARDLILSGWMMSLAPEERLHYLIALTEAGGSMTVDITRMQV